MSWGLTPMVLGPGTSIDYTIVFAGNLTGQFSLGFSAPKGISVNFTPSTVTLPSNQVVTDVRVQASDGLIPGDYAVVVIASGSAGSFSQTFQFRVVQRMIIIPQSGGSIIGFLPENLTVKVGSIVTWMSLDAGSDDTVGEHVVKFLTLNVTSPVLHLYDIWSHSFTQTGKFDYVDPINPQIAATVVVTD